ncbi:Aldo/keto reductase [Calocera viscosa TUFC12733]|uniref:Aldo/keto reductase n=1 Tax=Calocera viscosa (strain TUFC12733) TaxID=1330018 RepID=A0A167HNQ3_CALVF|nr:Aldo/keto reductase [Calocera viscosa TUFC12733]
MPEQKSVLNIVLGTGVFGDKGTLGARLSDLKEVEAILDVFQAHGHKELEWQKRGLVMMTKLYPTAATSKVDNPSLYHHNADGLRRGLEASLKALKANKIDTFYLHGPDRSVPYEETLKAVNELYKEGKFRRVGLFSFVFSRCAARSVLELV